MANKPFTVVLPTPITDLNLVSHSVPEDEFPMWVSGADYMVGDRVIYEHRIYEAILEVIAPQDLISPDELPTHWIEVGPTNQFAAFDESGGTFTTAIDSIEFVVTGSRIDSFGFLDVSALTIRVRASAPGFPDYFDNTYTLRDTAIVNSWYTYFNADIERESTFVQFGVPPLANSTYTITIEGSGPISIGTFVMGKQKEFGFTEYGATIGTKSYGRIEEDQFGRRTRVRRGFAKRMSVQIFMTRQITDAVKRQLEELRETPALWVAADGIYDSTSIFGDYRDFNIVLAFPNNNQCTLEIEGIA